jgi:hypothetical protein
MNSRKGWVGAPLRIHWPVNILLVVTVGLCAWMEVLQLTGMTPSTGGYARSLDMFCSFRPLETSPGKSTPQAGIGTLPSKCGSRRIGAAAHLVTLAWGRQYATRAGVSQSNRSVLSRAAACGRRQTMVRRTTGAR